MAARRLLLPVSSRAIRGCAGGVGSAVTQRGFPICPVVLPPPSPPYNASVSANGMNGTEHDRPVGVRGASVTLGAGTRKARTLNSSFTELGVSL